MLETPMYPLVLAHILSSDNPCGADNQQERLPKYGFIKRQRNF